MNGRLSKEARALEVARFAICDFQEQVGAVIKALAKLYPADSTREPLEVVPDKSSQAQSAALPAPHRQTGTRAHGP